MMDPNVKQRCIELLAEGKLTQAQIGAELGINPKSVFYVKSISTAKILELQGKNIDGTPMKVATVTTVRKEVKAYEEVSRETLGDDSQSNVTKPEAQEVCKEADVDAAVDGLGEVEKAQDQSENKGDAQERTYEGAPAETCTAVKTIEIIDAIVAWKLDYLTGSIVDLAVYAQGVTGAERERALNAIIRCAGKLKEVSA